MSHQFAKPTSLDLFTKSWRERRKNALFEQSTLQRSHILSTMRNSFTPPPPPNTKKSPKNSSKDASRWQKLKAANSHIASRFMLPEWLVDIPPDFGRDWLAYSIPPGPHCLVMASDGVTTAYNKSGMRLGPPFTSPLPGGSSASSGKKSAFTLLDCVFDEPRRTFFVRDVIFWNSVAFVDSDAEFRLFWAKSALEEKMALEEGASGEFRFRPVEVFSCSLDGLCKAFLGFGLGGGLQSDVEREVALERLKLGVGKLGGGKSFQDGVVFIHKQTAYVPGSNPLMLKWKDATSEYFLDDKNNEKFVALRVEANGTLCTFEGPVVKNKLTSEEIKARGLIPGEVVRFRYKSLELCFGCEGAIRAKFEGLCVYSKSLRSSAHQLSRLIFQRLARSGQTVSFAQIARKLC